MRAFFRKFFIIFLIGAVGLLCLEAESFGAKPDGKKSRIEAEKLELERLKKAIETEKGKISKLEVHEKSVLQKIQKIARGLKLQEKELKACDMELALNREKTRENVKILREIMETAQIQEEILAGRVRALYKEGDFSYLKVIFSSEGLSDLIRRITYMKVVAEADARLFQKVLEDKKKIVEAKEELDHANNQLTSLKKEILEKRNNYLKGKEEKSQYFKKIQREKSLYAKSVIELKASSASVLSLIKTLEGKEAAKISLKHLQGLRKGLIWPVEGKLISGFGKSVDSKYNITTIRHGIVIGSRFLESVRAVAEGKVLYSDWLKGYGQLLIIGHGKGYHSLYGYLDKFLVSVGSPVIKGQIIGEVGDTGAFYGASLYFEIRKNGKPDNPLSWLSASKK